MNHLYGNKYDRFLQCCLSNHVHLIVNFLWKNILQNSWMNKHHLCYLNERFPFKDHGIFTLRGNGAGTSSGTK